MKPSSQIEISRVSGAKNTFFIIDAFSEPWKSIYSSLTSTEKQKITKNLCTSFYGFKTDGLLFLHEKSNFDFAWDFYNSDGSFAEMCGNAARCASLFYFQRISAKKNIRFNTGAGDIGAEILNENSVKIEMSQISELKRMTVLKTSGIFVDTGVPHFVIEKKPDSILAKELRQVSDFGKSGANITFVENLENKFVDAVTFERGVEDFTQACGTGAVAAAMYFQDKIGSSQEVIVRMPGGTLTVQNAKPGIRPCLIGPAIIEFDILFDRNILVGRK